jgi:hypothetical protein
MDTNNNRPSPIQQLSSLAELRSRQAEIRSQLKKSENNMSDIWNDMFHKPSPSTLTSPTGKAINFLTNSAGIIDGAILGWKLYRRFGGTMNIFKKKK